MSGKILLTLKSKCMNNRIIKSSIGRPDLQRQRCKGKEHLEWLRQCETPCFRKLYSFRPSHSILQHKYQRLGCRVIPNQIFPSECHSGTNMLFHLFSFRYVYKRLKFLGNRSLSQAVALVFLAAWHGLHIGYYVCFFNEFIVMTFEKDVSFFHSFLFLDNLINGLYAFVDGGARSQKSHRSQFVYESGVGAVSMDNRKTLRLLFYGILPSPVHIFQ